MLQIDLFIVENISFDGKKEKKKKKANYVVQVVTYIQAFVPINYYPWHHSVRISVSISRCK